MPKIRVAVAGVGNCASALLQGIEYYRNAGEPPGSDIPGLMTLDIGGYRPGDIEIVAAFDRITSYNVCYTKLLRDCRVIEGSATSIILAKAVRESGGQRRSRRGKDFRGIRITSYNVCYTKLLRDCSRCSADYTGLLWRDQQIWGFSLISWSY